MHTTEHEGRRTMTTGTNTSERRFQELAYRENEGIEVSLVWDPTDNNVSVFVSDTKTGDLFELAVEDESPLEIFNHPYAYAASRGIEYQRPERQPVGA
jgi:hypothetical protein